MVFQPSVNNASDTQWKILVIDDDKDDFIIIKQLLKEAKGHNYSVDWAANYEAGQSALFSEPYHAVIIDDDLGAHSGIELIREAIARGYTDPLILYTGRGNDVADVDALQAGATMCLTKGEVSPLLLEHAIRYAIDRKQTEKALCQSEEKFARAFQYNPAAMSITRMADAQFTDANQSFCQMVGFSREEIIGHTAVELGLLSMDTLDAILRQFHEKGHVYQREITITTKHGTLRQGLLTLDPIETGGGPCRLATMIDITERKQAELALRQSEARLQARAKELEAILDAVPAYMWITHDPQAREMTGNLAVFNLVNLKPGENISKTGPEPEKVHHFKAMRDGKEIPVEELPVQRVAASGVPLRNHEFEMVIDNGEVQHLLGNVSPLFDEQGHPAGAVSAFIDITDRKHIEQKLQQSESRFRVALASAPITVFTTDHNLHITWMYNPQPGYQLKQVLGLRLDQIVPDEQGKQLLQIQQAVIDSGQPSQGEIESVVFGKHAFFVYSIDPVRDASGKITGLACAGYDITDRKLAEQNLQHYAEELERSNQALSDFAFIASHDLQEPLRKVIMFAKSLRKHSFEALDQESEEYLDRMENAAERMQKMISGLLELSRVNARGKEFAPVNLTRVVEEVVSDLEPRLQILGGQVQIEELPTIEADELQMHQIFQNLIGNAIKFHKPGVPPVVHVSASGTHSGTQNPCSQMVEIRVEDNGIGIEQQSTGRIFQPFIRLHGKSEYEGTGLGLAICQKIIERHHGKVEVQSTPGQGTTFILQFPLR